MAADAYAIDVDALANETADDPVATADEKQGRRRHAAAIDADIAAALHTLHQAKGLR